MIQKLSVVLVLSVDSSMYHFVEQTASIRHL
jgi:hypothetical protein